MLRCMTNASLTPWQTAKPIIRDLVRNVVTPTGFAGPGLTMHRYRSDFVDMIHFSTSTGNDIVLSVGCDPRNLMKGVTPASKNACLLTPAEIFWCQGTNEYAISNNAEAIRDVVTSCVLPQLQELLDNWFPLFADLDRTIHLISQPNEIVRNAHPDSNMHRFVLFALRHARKTTESLAQDWNDSGLPPIAGLDQI